MQCKNAEETAGSHKGFRIHLQGRRAVATALQRLGGGLPREPQAGRGEGATFQQELVVARRLGLHKWLHEHMRRSSRLHCQVRG